MPLNIRIAFAALIITAALLFGCLFAEMASLSLDAMGAAHVSITIATWMFPVVALAGANLIAAIWRA